MLCSRRSCHVFGVATLGLGLLAATPAQAHFVLQSPAALSEQNQVGDPQKAPPCGDAGNAVATGMVTSYKAGDVVTITLDETIFHPGHYRVSLALNDISELPEEPPVTADNKSDCGSVPIDPAPVFPVLADGLLVHTEPFGGTQTIEVTLPADVSCDNCTLQVIQFMSNHGLNNPGGCFYHHCATISIEGGVVATTGADESGGETTTSTTTNATSTATSQDDTAAPQTTADESGGSTSPGAPTPGTGDAPTTSAPATTTATGTGGEDSSGSSGTTANDAEDSGCGCSGTSGGHGPATLVTLLGLLGLRARRRVAG